MTRSEDVIITQDAERSDVFALVESLADGQKPRALNVPAGALGALAAVGAGLVFLARGWVRRV